MSKRNFSSTQGLKSKKQKFDDNCLSNNNNIGRLCDNNNDFLQFIPSGFKFCPTEQELIMAYLRKKVMNEQLEPNLITEVEIYKYNPEQLSRQYRSNGENEWYFFCPRDRKKVKRSTEDGYWKAIGKYQSIYSENGSLIGQRRTLVYYEGNHQQSNKTNWIMREYWLDGTTNKRTSSSDMKMDDWVLCKIYKNNKNYTKSCTKEEACIESIEIESTQSSCFSTEILPQQPQSNNMMPLELTEKDPIQLNSHSSEISHASSTPPSPTKSKTTETSSLLDVDDVWDLIDLDNLDVNNNDYMSLDNKLPPLMDIPEIMETSRLIMEEPSNDLYTLEDIVNYHCNHSSGISHASSTPPSLTEIKSEMSSSLHDEVYMPQDKILPLAHIPEITESSRLIVEEPSNDLYTLWDIFNYHCKTI